MSMKTTVLNCPIDLRDEKDALLLVGEAICDKKNFHIITINPEMIMNAQKDKFFFDILNNSDLNIIDGIGVKIALKLDGINQKQIRGVDFARALIKLAAENNYRIGFLGAKEEIIEKAKENFLTVYPNLNIVFCKNGYYNNEDKIIQEIKNASPQILLIGLGSPKQEKFIVKLKQILEGCSMIGVGGSFDVLSGNVREAPLLFRKTGLEWLYRTIIEPKRLRRIFPVLPIFLLKCIINSIQKKG